VKSGGPTAGSSNIGSIWKEWARLDPLPVCLEKRKRKLNTLTFQKLGWMTGVLSPILRPSQVCGADQSSIPPPIEDPKECFAFQAPIPLHFHLFIDWALANEFTNLIAQKKIKTKCKVIRVITLDDWIGSPTIGNADNSL
jgi:hypothetical protein